MNLLFASLFGVVAGLRTMTAPTAVAWAAHLRILHLDDTPLAFMRHRYTAGIFTIFALGELVGDKLQVTPSRKTPPQFVARVLSGALCGACVTATSAGLVPGALAGVAGAVTGTLAGAATRSRLAAAFGRDLPAALLEDTGAVVSAALLTRAL